MTEALGKRERTGTQRQHPTAEHSLRSQTHRHCGDSAARFKAILAQENFTARPRAARGWEMQPSSSQHPCEVPLGIHKQAFSSLARKRVTATNIPEKFLSPPGTWGGLRGAAATMQAVWGGEISLQLCGEARLLLTQQSCDRRRDMKSSRERSLSPHAGFHHPSMPQNTARANRQRCPQGGLTLLGPCLPQSPPASRRSATAWHLLSLLPWGRTKRSVRD